MTGSVTSLVIGLLIQTSSTFNHSEVWSNNAGVDAYQKEDYETALKDFSRAASKAPDNPALQHNLGTTFIKTGQPDKAIGQFQKGAQSADPLVQQRSYYNLGTTLLNQAESLGAVNPESANPVYQQAAASLIEALKRNPEDGNARTNLAYALKRIKEMERQKQDKQDKQDEKQNNDDQKSDSEEQQKKDNDQKEDRSKQKQDSQSKDSQKDQNEQPQHKNPPSNNSKADEKQTQTQDLTKEEVERILQAVEEEEQQHKTDKQIEVERGDRW